MHVQIIALIFLELIPVFTISPAAALPQTLPQHHQLCLLCSNITTHGHSRHRTHRTKLTVCIGIGCNIGWVLNLIIVLLQGAVPADSPETPRPHLPKFDHEDCSRAPYSLGRGRCLPTVRLPWGQFQKKII